MFQSLMLEIYVIEKCSFHNSHLKGKTVYGHQILVSLLPCDWLVLPYSIDIYNKAIMSKIELSESLIKSLPKPENKGFVLCDSWYSCKNIFNASVKASYSYIGALKTNRVIFPKDYTDRWAIEPFFRDCKTYLGLDGYQVRSERSIIRYLLLMIINYTYCKLYSNESYHFNIGFKLAQNDFQKAKVI